MATACCSTPAGGPSTRVCPATVTSSTTAGAGRRLAAAPELMLPGVAAAEAVVGVAGVEGVAAAGAAEGVEDAGAKQEHNPSDLLDSDNVAIQVDTP